MGPAVNNMIHAGTHIEHPTDMQTLRPLPGPLIDLSIADEQRKLVGVARWPDARFNKESSPENQDYGRWFHALTVEGGERIAQGQVQSFRQLWDFMGRARHARAEESSPAQSGPGAVHRAAGSAAFSSSYPRDTNVGTITPFTGPYAYLVPRARAVATSVEPNVMAQTLMADESHADLPEDFMSYETVQARETLGNREVPLTKLRMAKYPEDFDHPIASEKYTEDGRLKTMALAFSFEHTNANEIQPIMNHVEGLFQEIVGQPHSRESLLTALGNVHWWMAHAMPDKRGSAAKTELCVRALANAHGVELPPFERGVIPDLEAFVCSRSEFVDSYAAMFDKASSA